MRPLRVVLLAGFAGFAATARDTRANLASRTIATSARCRSTSLGRPPTRDELAAFEKPDFDLDAWIDTHLTGDAYAERLRRIYMDAAAARVGPTLPVRAEPASMLRRQQCIGPDGAPMYVYFRRGQRRVDAAPTATSA